MATETSRPTSNSWTNNNGGLSAILNPANAWDNNTTTRATLYGTPSYPSGSGVADLRFVTWSGKTQTWSQWTAYVDAAGVGADGANALGKIDFSVSTDGGTNWSLIGTITFGGNQNTDYHTTPVSYSGSGDITQTNLIFKAVETTLNGNNGLCLTDGVYIYELYVIGTVVVNYPKTLTTTTLSSTATVLKNVGATKTTTAVVTTATMTRVSKYIRTLTTTTLSTTATILKSVAKTIVVTPITLTASLIKAMVYPRTLTTTPIVVSATLTKAANYIRTLTTTLSVSSILSVIKRLVPTIFVPNLPRKAFVKSEIRTVYPTAKMKLLVFAENRRMLV